MRKTVTVTIVDDNRDKGKSFLVTEMPASQAEKWAARALLALAKSGTTIPPDIFEAGWGGIAVIGIRALMGIQFYEAEPLIDEMMACVKFIPDVNRPELAARALIEDDIEEVITRLKLKDAALELHTGFSVAVAQSKSTAASQTQEPQSSSPTPTSPPGSGPLSRLN